MSHISLTKLPTLEDLVPFNSKLIRSSIDKFVPLVAVRSKEFSAIDPAALHYKTHCHSGEGKLAMAQALLDGRVAQVSDRARDVLYQDLLDGGSDIAYKHGSDIEVLAGIYAFRARCYEQRGPLPGHAALLERLRTRGHHLDVETPRGAWVTDAGLQSHVGRAHGGVLLWAGDRYALLDQHRETLLNLVRLLRAAGVEFAVLGEAEPSTARAALDIGDTALFEAHARTVARAIERSGAKTVVCADALDYCTLRAHVPKVVALPGVRVVHAVEELDRALSQRRIRPRTPVRTAAAYHDAATLGRLSEPFVPWEGEMRKVLGQLVVYDPPRHVNRGTSGCYEPPRRVLRRIPGVRLVEFERCRERAFAVADEGVVVAAGFGDFVDAAAAHRLAEAEQVGAETVVTACPNSLDNLSRAAAQAPPGRRAEVVDIVDLLARSQFGGE